MEILMKFRSQFLKRSVRAAVLVMASVSVVFAQKSPPATRLWSVGPLTKSEPVMGIAFGGEVRSHNSTRGLSDEFDFCSNSQRCLRGRPCCSCVECGNEKGRGRTSAGTRLSASVARFQYGQGQGQPRVFGVWIATGVRDE